MKPKRVKGLCLLEIELVQEDEEVRLPPFLEVEKEVTEDSSYSNYAISRQGG